MVAFKRTSRQPYPFAQKLASQLTVHAIRPGKQEIAEFPGYRSVRLTKHQLDHIVNARSGSNQHVWVVRRSLSEIINGRLLPKGLTHAPVGEAEGARR